MKLKIKKKTFDKWRAMLLKAGSREVGGVLFGEHVGESDFRVIDATQQSKGGGQAHFRRSACKAKRALKKLRAVYGDDHERFNYLGEWHSHPNSPVIPSPKDERTMEQLLLSPDTGANFLILIILKLADDKTMEISARAYLASGHALHVDVEIESDEES